VARILKVKIFTSTPLIRNTKYSEHPDILPLRLTYRRGSSTLPAFLLPRVSEACLLTYTGGIEGERCEWMGGWGCGDLEDKEIWEFGDVGFEHRQGNKTTICMHAGKGGSKEMGIEREEHDGRGTDEETSRDLGSGQLGM